MDDYSKSMMWGVKTYQAPLNYNKTGSSFLAGKTYKKAKFSESPKSSSFMAK
jgi:hypothetical protein